jgi:hypothetical protein
MDKYKVRDGHGFADAKVNDWSQDNQLHSNQGHTRVDFVFLSFWLLRMHG